MCSKLNHGLSAALNSRTRIRLLHREPIRRYNACMTYVKMFMLPLGKYAFLVWAWLGLVGQVISDQNKELQSKPAPSDKVQERIDESKAPATEKKPARFDSLGDLMPPDAVSRMGTVRMRHEHSVLTVAF